MPIPKPGTPVRGSKTGAPMMALFDLMGRRWAMGIIWQLSDGCLRFSDLRQRCTSISPTILSRRIKDLTEAGFILQTLEGYELTAEGLKLFRLLEPFRDFALDWAKHFNEAES